MTDKTGVKLEERIVYAYGGKGGDVLKNEFKTEGSFMFRTKMEVPPAPPKLGPAASTLFPHSPKMTEDENLYKDQPYSWWKKVLIFNTNSRVAEKKRQQGKDMVKAIQRVMEKLIHSAKREMYVPNSVPVDSQDLPKFDLVTRDEFKSICMTAKRLIEKQDETLVDVDAPAKIFGDIHGQITDLLQMFRLYGTPSHRVGDVNICNYVFAGDFVDRGSYSLEVLLTLLCLKVRYHPHITLLRGNHEDFLCNTRYGFLNECERRLEEGNEFYQKYILPLFQVLPLAALVEKKILVCHGGPGLHVKTLQDIRDIPRPITVPTHVNKYAPDSASDEKKLAAKRQNIVVDLLWSDPTRKVGLTLEKDFEASYGKFGGNAYNRDRGTGTCFGPDTVKNFCTRNKISMIVRAHECVSQGVRLSEEGNLITVFTAPKYGGGDNGGAIVEVSRRLDVHFKALRAEHSKGSSWSNTTNLDRPRDGSSTHPPSYPLVTPPSIEKSDSHTQAL